MTVEHVHRRLWQELAVEFSAYHRADCDWVVVGVSVHHCSCGLTWKIAELIWALLSRPPFPRQGSWPQ